MIEEPISQLSEEINMLKQHIDSRLEQAIASAAQTNEEPEIQLGEEIKVPRPYITEKTIRDPKIQLDEEITPQDRYLFDCLVNADLEYIVDKVQTRGVRYYFLQPRAALQVCEGTQNPARRGGY